MAETMQFGTLHSVDLFENQFLLLDWPENFDYFHLFYLIVLQLISFLLFLISWFVSSLWLLCFWCEEFCNSFLNLEMCYITKFEFTFSMLRLHYFEGSFIVCCNRCKAALWFVFPSRRQYLAALSERKMAQAAIMSSFFLTASHLSSPLTADYSWQMLPPACTMSWTSCSSSAVG